MSNPYTEIYNAAWEAVVAHPKNANLRRIWDNVSDLWVKWEEAHE